MNKKLKEWAKRYLPPEIPATICSMIAAILVFRITQDPIVTAYAGVIGDNVGYYGFIFIRDYVRARKTHTLDRIQVALRTVKNLLIEFGFSEFLDSLFIRPFCMYIFPIILGDLAMGIFTGKIVADIFFYIFSATAYEFRKKHVK